MPCFTRIRHRRITVRAVAASLAALMFWAAGPAHGDPADIFDIGAPAVGTDPPKNADIDVGDTKVATQTGSFDYSYPVDVPPGRNGMQPHLALAYSSQAPIYGGIANGWSLPIPSISLDTSAGRLWSTDPTGGQRYVSSLAGGRPLVKVAEPFTAPDVLETFRAKNDSTFARYERISARGGPVWRVRTLDGQTLTFGQGSHMSGAFTGGTYCDGSTYNYAPLTETVDAFGNAVDYYYEGGVSGECRIAAITWGQNANAGVSDFARIRFNYSNPPAPSDCPAGTQIGAQSSFRYGYNFVTGASQLDSIVVTAYAPGQSGTATHTRTIRLGYTPDAGVEQTATCSATHAAYRSLYSIQESAVGADRNVDLPAIKFSYGSAQFGSGGLQWSTTTRSALWGAVPAIPSAGANYNLGWGYRYNDASGRWPTVEAMMLDVDGDGLVDRVYNAPYTTNDGKYHCGAKWVKNLGNLAFDPNPRTIAMPTLKWATQDMSCTNPSRYVGSPTPNANPQRPIEQCSLNYQRTDYQNSPATAVVQCKTQPTCPTAGFCTDPNADDYGTPCNQQVSPGPTVLSYRWMDIDGDGLTDLVASPTIGSTYNLGRGVGLCGDTPPSEPPLLGGVPRTCPFSWYGVAPTVNAYTMCHNMYPWSIYLNKGNGQFGVAGSDPANPMPDRVVYQPTPLETESGDSSVTSMPVGQKLGTADIDGDGAPDGIDAQTSTWSVFRNDYAGHLMPTTAPVGGFSFTTNGDQLGSTDYSNPDANGYVSPIGSSGLFDINGDGLPDHWASAAPYATTSFEMNTGTGFYAGGLISNVRPGSDGYVSCYGGCKSDIQQRVDTRTGKVYLSGWYPVEAQRWDASRVIDADLDGRPDVVQFLSGTQTPGTHLNQGGALSPAFVSVGDVTALRHKMVANDKLTLNLPALYTWEIRSDVTDLDGDGIPEGVSFSDHDSSYGQMSISKIATPTQPPRLLVGIDNGRGANTSITYAAMSDSTVVTRTAGLVMPRTGWVVRSVTTVDAVAGTTETTAYQYANPHFSGEGDLTKEIGTTTPPQQTTQPTVVGPSNTHTFRGFESATATHPSGAKTTERYSYSVDWSGRLVETLQIPAEAPSEVRSIDRTTWIPVYLFCDPSTGCALKTYHASITEHRVCRNGQTENACLANTDGVSRHGISWQPLASSTSGGANVIYVATRDQRTGAPGASQEGDLIEQYGYSLVSDATNYRLFKIIENHTTVKSGSVTSFAITTHGLDPSYRVMVSDSVWLDTTAKNLATTRRVYDMTTGNVLERWKPVQNAANTVRTVYTYDAQKLFPATEVDEVGNELDYAYEYGTGTKVTTIGPNTASCALANPPSCPAGSFSKQIAHLAIDAMGRTIERWDSFSDDGSYYTPYKVETFAYTDTYPNSVTHQKAISVNASGGVSYAQDKTDLDGHGRTVKNTAYVFGSAPADQITTYRYGNDGTLRYVSVPDPTANGTATVTYSYGYDSLGRPTSLRRPDTSVLTDQSGVNISYDGLTTTTTEVLKSGDGNAAVTKTTKDNFGRLVEVDEELANSPLLSWAATTYKYDAADRVTTIVDPENLTTNILYDFAGHRAAISRPNGAWTFTYDKNGNVASLTTPHTCALGDPCDARYVTTYAYDNLDRVTSKLLAHRELSTADLTLFAADKETFAWDAQFGSAGNYKGQLTTVSSWAPGATAPAITTNLQHDAQGHDVNTYEIFAAAGYNAIGQRAYGQSYNISGSLNRVVYWDYVGNGGINTSATYNYDARGLPLSVSLTRVNQGTQTVALQTRNVAGLVTNRRTTITGTPTSPMTFVESNWTYDKLGRVSSQIVQKGPGPTLVAEQALTYFGNDDPRTLDQYLGASHKQFSYGYDNRHQLTSAVETTTSGYFNAAYTYGNAGRFTRATEASPSPAAGSEVKPRDVTYEYAGADPEQVTGLVNAGNGTTFASYTYDASGNQTARCYGRLPCTGESTEYVYDGADRLRRATKKQNGVTLASEEYFYNGSEARLATVKRDASGTKTELIWWLHDTEAHYDGSGVKQHVYSYVSLGTPVARTDRDGTGTAKLELTFHGLANNTLAAVDRDTGAVNTSFSYAPFGEIVESTDAGASSGAGVAAHRRRISDKYDDEVSGLSYFGYRYYDPVALQWTQHDPLFRFRPEARWGQPRMGNLYTYVANNPLRYIDPDGRLAEGWLVAAGDGLSAGIEVGEKTVPAGAETGGPVGAAVGVGAAVVVAAAVTVYVLVSGPDATAAKTTDLPPAGAPEPGRSTSENSQPHETAPPAPSPDAGGAGKGDGAPPKDDDCREGVIYEVPGSGTPSGQPYVGRTVDLDKRTKNARDGRDRKQAKVIDRYKGTKQGRLKEQCAMDDRGGVKKLDNKRNEIRKKKILE